MMIIIGLLIGAAVAAGITLLFGVYTIGPTERGIVSTFGRAQRLGRQMTADDPHLRALLSDEEADRYNYPVLRVIPPGGPYFKWPWQKIQKINMTIQPIDMAWDPEKPDQTTIECVTKDNLTIDVSGQIRWKPCERNLYPYAFGIAHPQVHVMGFFVSVLRDRIATFERVREGEAVEGVSINDLRRNLSEINRYMEEACRRSEARYGIELDASLITTIDPPANVDDALASINTTHNNVAASISQARAEAEQRLKLAEQAVQIAENEAHAEAAPLLALAQTLTEIHAAGGRGALDTYVRNATLPLRARANQTVVQL